MECLFPVKIIISQKWSAVPCGKCLPCLKKASTGWAVRLMAEHREAKTAWFITLTYDNDHLPFNLETLTPTLVKSDVQKFLKRLRKNSIHKDKILYYAVGELGEKTKRPHYHIILFNADIPTIEKSWTLGHVYYGDVNMRSIMYVLGYLLNYTERQNTFRLSSKGLGLPYLSTEKVQWHCDDILLRYYAPLGNKKLSLPRYLKERIYSPDERKLIADNCYDGQLWKNVDKFSLENIEKMDVLRAAYPVGVKIKSNKTL